MKKIFINSVKENNKVILDRKDFDYLMSIGHYNDKAIEYINKHLVVDSYSPLYDEETKILDDEFSYEDLLCILEDKIK